MLATLLLMIQLAFGAGPEWQVAPKPIEERPVVEAPPGGWYTEQGTEVDVHGDAADAAVVRSLADHAAVALPALAERMGVPAGRHVDVYLAPTQEMFDEIQPGTPPDWADGTAYARSGLIFLRSPHLRPGTATELATVLDHELVHVLLGSAFGPRPVPRWLQEGMAQYYAGEIGTDLPDKISAGLLGPGLLHIQDLAYGFPADPQRAHLAYAQSADFISWIAATHGERSLRVLIAQLAAGEGIDPALRAATGTDVESMDTAWRARLTTSTMWLRAIAGSGILWFVAIVGLGVGWWRRRKRNRERMRRWEREEAYQVMLEEQRRRAMLARSQEQWLN